MTVIISLGSLIEAFALFHDSIMAAMIAGVLLGVIGVFIVLGRMVFVSAALSQTASLGVTLSFWLNAQLGLTLISPSVGAALVSLMSIILIWKNRHTDRDKRDRMLGAIFLIGGAGTLMVASRIVNELHDVKTLLFGSSVAVLPEELQQICILSTVILLIYLWWWRGFVEVTYDEDTARVRGMPVPLIKFVLMLTIALSVSACTRVLGALPSFAFGVFPAMGAVALASNISRAMIVAAFGGACSGLGGYAFAYLFDFPVGSSQTMTAAVFWIFCVLVGRLASTQIRSVSDG